MIWKIKTWLFALKILAEKLKRNYLKFAFYFLFPISYFFHEANRRIHSCPFPGWHSLSAPRKKKGYWD
jgi:hypothetical protein